MLDECPLASYLSPSICIDLNTDRHPAPSSIKGKYGPSPCTSKCTQNVQAHYLHLPQHNTDPHLNLQNLARIVHSNYSSPSIHIYLNKNPQITPRNLAIARYPCCDAPSPPQPRCDSEIYAPINIHLNTDSHLTQRQLVLYPYSDSPSLPPRLQVTRAQPSTSTSTQTHI